jgi:hypothetical protein
MQNQVSLGLGNAFSGRFMPYSVEQVHLTIIGLEGGRSPQGIINDNYLKFRNAVRIMDFTAMLRSLQQTPLLPLTARFGGFRQTKPYPFQCWGRHPYEMSFVIMGDKVALNGWPYRNGLHVSDLNLLRQTMTGHGILHKYFPKASDKDNDLFMVIGRLDSTGMSDKQAGIFRHQIDLLGSIIRRKLAYRRPFVFNIGWRDLFLVQYQDPSLPWGSSFFLPLSQRPSAAQVQALY